MKKKSKTPSRIKYEESHPTVSFRVSRELYDRLQAIKKAEGKSITDVLKVGVGLLEVKVRAEAEIRIKAFREGHRKGYELAEANYKCTFPCSGCGETIAGKAKLLKKLLKSIWSGVGGVTLIVLTENNHSGHCTQQRIGFKADFFAEVLHALRDRGGYSEYVASHLKITGTDDMRDKKAIERIVGAYLKLLFPDLRLTAVEFEKYCIEPAVKLRQGIRDQLSRMDPEYKVVSIHGEVL